MFDADGTRIIRHTAGDLPRILDEQRVRLELLALLDVTTDAIIFIEQHVYCRRPDLDRQVTH